MTKGPRILLTGPPGVGKTTLVRRVAGELAHRHPAGFYTDEIREAGIRKGFALMNLDGRRGCLSHVEISGPHRVGKYGVDVQGFEEFLDTIEWFRAGVALIVIDEIGKMECISARFRALVRALLDSDRSILATVARQGGGLIAEVKERSDVDLLQLTRRNRDSLTSEIARRLT